MLMRVSETALLELEKSELKHFNFMLYCWDNDKVKALTALAQDKEEALKDGTLDKEDLEQLQWMEDLIWKAKKRREHFAHDTIDLKNNKPSLFEPFLLYHSCIELCNIEAGEIFGANPIAHLKKHHYGLLYYGKFLKNVSKSLVRSKIKFPTRKIISKSKTPAYRQTNL